MRTGLGAPRFVTPEVVFVEIVLLAIVVREKHSLEHLMEKFGAAVMRAEVVIVIIVIVFIIGVKKCVFATTRWVKVVIRAFFGIFRGVLSLRKRSLKQDKIAYHAVQNMLDSVIETSE